MATTRRGSVPCPECRTPMNHHAEKLLVTSNAQEPGMDPELGGVVDEMHACPVCGNILSRRAT